MSQFFPVTHPTDVAAIRPGGEGAIYQVLSRVEVDGDADLNGLATLIAIEMNQRGYAADIFTIVEDVCVDIVDDENRAVRLCRGDN